MPFHFPYKEWRMINRSACSLRNSFLKKSSHSGENFFPFQCDNICFLEFILLGNLPTSPMSSYNQMNKKPVNLYVNFKSVSVISLGTQRPHCFSIVKKPWKQLIDIHEKSSFNKEKTNPFRVHGIDHPCKASLPWHFKLCLHQQQHNITMPFSSSKSRPENTWLLRSLLVATCVQHGGYVVFQFYLWLKFY